MLRCATIAAIVVAANGFTRVVLASQIRELQRHAAPQASLSTAATARALASEREEQRKVHFEPATGPTAWRWINGRGHATSWEDVIEESHHAERTRQNAEVHVACDSAV